MYEAAAEFGLMPIFQHEQVEPLYLWPENVVAWSFFQAVSTQWQVDYGRPIGLNYAGVEVARNATRIKNKDWPTIFSAVQAMERATLSAWREKSK